MTSITAEGGKAFLQQKFIVGFEYPVWFVRDAFAADNDLVAGLLGGNSESPPGEPPRCLAYIDSGVAAAWPSLAAEIAAYFAVRPAVASLMAPPRTLPGGAPAKVGWEVARKVMDDANTFRLDRQGYILCVGGGSLLDAVGFAASIIHRGVRLIRFPSTVLAQNDAGLGVKNGLDLDGQKNSVGAFAPPHAVVNDAKLLATLREEDWLGGVAEALKVAIIKDAEFFEFIESKAGELRGRGGEGMEKLVRRCAEIHLGHIANAGDPFESGSSRPLDFGHWAAHQLEVASNWRIGHGLAVAAGIAVDTRYAVAAGWLDTATGERVLATLRAAGLPCGIPAEAVPPGNAAAFVTEGLSRFREHLGGRLTVILPRSLGDAGENHEIDHKLMVECLVDVNGNC